MALKVRLSKGADFAGMVVESEYPFVVIAVRQDYLRT